MRGYIFARPGLHVSHKLRDVCGGSIKATLFTNSERICTECIAWLRQLHFAANKFMKARFFSRGACGHTIYTRILSCRVHRRAK